MTDCTPHLTTVVHSRSDQVITFQDATASNISQKRAILRRFAAQALASYATGQPSADHLLQLIQLNLINSLTRNALLLGLTSDWLVCSAVSPFGLGCSWLVGGGGGSKTFPDNLAPTALQLQIPHHPWVDLFPLPRMRDNFLAAVSAKLSVAKEEELWNDMVESEGEGGTDWGGLIVWGESWDPRNWEVTVPFLQKWGWLLEGCREILEATDYWRRRRGEGPLSLGGSWVGFGD